jgi:hypothetical protein
MLGFHGFDEFVGVLKFLIFWSFVLALILGLAVGPRYIRSRDRQRMYEAIKLGYEKGQPVPPELIAALQGGGVERTEPVAMATSDVNGDLRRAVVLIAVGLGLAGLGAGLDYGISFASGVGGAVTGGIVAGVGAIPGFIGVAYLILWLLSRGAAKSTSPSS